MKIEVANVICSSRQAKERFAKLSGSSLLASPSAIDPAACSHQHLEIGPWERFNEPINLAVDSVFGLGGGVITSDTARGKRIAADLMEGAACS